MRKKRKKISKINIDDVARAAGVSITTVSRVINNVSTVNDENRRRVEAAIKKMGFTPDTSARRLAGGKITTVGLIIPRFDDMFYTYYVTQIMRSVCQSASELGLDVLVHLTSKDLKEQALGTHLANLSSCNGVIFADIHGNERLLSNVIKANIPCIVMNHFDKVLECGCIGIDNKGGAIKAIDHMVSLGHQRIAIITGDLNIQAGKERFEGYKEGLKKHGIRISPELIKKGNFSPQSAHEACLELLRLNIYPTAIFIASDEMAIEAVKTLRYKGINVPQVISIVGFDDSWFANQGPVGITTIRQDLNAMGKLALTSIIQNASGKSTKALLKKIMPTELIIRESCVAPLKSEDFY